MTAPTPRVPTNRPDALAWIVSMVERYTSWKAPADTMSDELLALLAAARAEGAQEQAQKMNAESADPLLAQLRAARRGEYGCYP